MKNSSIFGAAVLSVASTLSGCGGPTATNYFTCEEIFDRTTNHLHSREALVDIINNDPQIVPQKEISIKFFRQEGRHREPVQTIKGAYNPEAAVEVARTYCATGTLPAAATWSAAAPSP